MGPIRKMMPLGKLRSEDVTLGDPSPLGRRKAYRLVSKRNREFKAGGRQVSKRLK